MENNIQIFSNEEYGEIRVRLLAGNEIEVNLEDAARGLGFTVEQTIGDKTYSNIRWDRVKDYLADIGFLPEVVKDAYIPERVFYRLAMKAKNERAVRFQCWLADVAHDIRQKGAYVGAAITPALLRRLADELERSQVTAAKPALLEGRLTRTWTVTRIAAEYDMSAQWLNRTLWELGIQRPWGKTWRLTASALREMRRRGEEWVIIAQYERELADGSIKYGAPYMRWTDAGRRYIHEMLAAQGIERKWVE